MTIFDDRLARLTQAVLSSKTSSAAQWRRRSNLSRVIEA
ncbi:nickel ABC transporter, permease protein, partial [Pseudomonas syringae pv. actinidiae ICMP 18886]